MVPCGDLAALNESAFHQSRYCCSPQLLPFPSALAAYVFWPLLFILPAASPTVFGVNHSRACVLWHCQPMWGHLLCSPCAVCLSHCVLAAFITGLTQRLSSTCFCSHHLSWAFINKLLKSWGRKADMTLVFGRRAKRNKWLTSESQRRASSRTQTWCHTCPYGCPALKELLVKVYVPIH